MENGVGAEHSRMLTAADAEMEKKMKTDTLCGVGSCKTKKYANMWLFSFNLALILLFHISLFSYAVGTMRTVEKRFGLSSAEIGLVGAINDILQIATVMFAGYFGRKTHKPRYISITVLATVIGAYMAASPFFIYGPKEYDPALIASFSKGPSVSNNQIMEPKLESDFSHFENHSHGISYSALPFMNKTSSLQICDLDAEPAKCSEVSQKERDSNRSAFYILALAQLWFGIGMSGIGTLGLSYIDENVKKDDSAIYIAVVTSMYALSPIIGFSLAAVSTRMAEDLSELPIPFYHPQFVGCWWLGYVVLGTLILFSAIPMFFFPKHLETYYIVYKKPRLEAAAKAGTIKVDEDKSTMAVIISHMKGFPLALWQLLSEPAYLCLTLCKVASMYLIVGHILNLPRYMEIHFGKPAYVANIVSAISGAIGGAGGNVIGGVIMKKLHLKPRGSVAMFVMAIVVTLTGLTIFMLVRCPQVPFAGEHDPEANLINVTLPCNANCSCSRDKYQPMCSSEGVMYFSPCHAGCTESSYFNGTYRNCACLNKNETLVSGACTQPCGVGFYVYVVTFFLMSFVGSMARTPATILMFRIVPEDLKAFALSINSFLFNVLVFVPGPIVFGMLFDTTCLVWGQNCEERGACYFYNIKDYRHYMHGVTMVFQVIALILAILTGYFVHKLFRKGGKLYEGEKRTQLPLSEGLLDHVEKEKVQEQYS